MRSNEVTIDEVLKTAGYTTGCFGKWHNGREYSYHPNGQGFDEFLGFCGGHFNKYVNPLLERNGKPVKTTGFITDVLTDELLKFVRKNKEKPFFAYVPYNAPHGPYQILQKYYDKFADLDSDEKTKLIYGMVENIDHNIGRLLELLDELDISPKHGSHLSGR